MLSSPANDGQVDFANAKRLPRKCPVSDEVAELVEKILDTYQISDKTKKELQAPTRHFLWYAAKIFSGKFKRAGTSHHAHGQLLKQSGKQLPSFDIALANASCGVLLLSNTLVTISCHSRNR